MANSLRLLKSSLQPTYYNKTLLPDTVSLSDTSCKGGFSKDVICFAVYLTSKPAPAGIYHITIELGMSEQMSQSPNPLQQQAQAALKHNNYAQAALLYEQLMELEPEQISHAWLLGLARLLAGDEAEAQLTWMMALSMAEPEQVEAWTAELVQLLQGEADRQETAAAWQTAWVVRQHLHEIVPTDLHNLLHLVRLAIKLDLTDSDYLEAIEVTELLRSPVADLDQQLLLNTVIEALEQWFDDFQVKAFTEAALEQICHPKLILDTLIPVALRLNNYGTFHQANLAAYLAEICLRYDPANLEALRLLALYAEAVSQYTEAIAIARQFRAACQTLDEQMVGNGFLAVRLLRTGQHWQEARDLFEQQEALLQQLLSHYTTDAKQSLIISILTSCCFYPYYLDDAPAQHRKLQNQLAALLQTDLQAHAKTALAGCRQRLAAPVIHNRKLKIGYIARYLRQHSVGWLARWLMQHHDRDRFDIYTYHVHRQESDPFTQRWFVQTVTGSTWFAHNTCVEMAQHICETDQIDILVDLDSITYDHTYGVMALRPAPIQVTWLGFDASGLPAVDYFIADPYVLPETAQDYYSEKIWRLPHTYLAVDGFEVGIPTLRRDHLNIPADAVIYWSAQSGQKRHPDTMRLQAQILRQVPNSYLLVKGIADEALLKTAFEQIAEQEGVGRDRLRFLSRDPDELTHRANLGIADVVLDTYPYNGATTTLETLWVGVPLVTRVGQQWAARNSYTMLMNVGVSEGIAWTDEEYVEWGVRLGKDAALRQDIHQRLLRSRQTSPLWNSQQFAREMENAYEQMWAKSRFC